ncbi:unnamed protein product [Pipistrellus nathusii]|uniref:Uncharacterized protein n=1 Tax=Pipistrellus nathusii TaxID=59473 RepID=A0ABP0AEN7_PIPNA
MMLQCMHGHRLDQDVRFMRADDDVDIWGTGWRASRPAQQQRAPVPGPDGLGASEGMGQLALEPGENFCMPPSPA